MADPGHSEPSHSTVNVAADVANIDNPVSSTAMQDEQPQLAAINTIASSAESSPTNATAAETANTEATPARAASTAFVGCPISIAQGDGDLMPPCVTDDSHTDADDWLQDFLDYINIRQVPKTTASILLRNRLTGATRKWFEALPGGIDFDETTDDSESASRPAPAATTSYSTASGTAGRARTSWQAYTSRPW